MDAKKPAPGMALAKQFFQMFNSNLAVRTAWKEEMQFAESRGPISSARIDQLMRLPVWSNQIQELGEALRPIIIQQLKFLSSDALARHSFLKVIDEINDHGPFDDAAYNLIEKGKLPDRMKRHVAGLKPYFT